MSKNLAEKPILSKHSENEIQKQLNLILSNELFSRSTVLSNFLKFIVEETLNGNTDSLKEYTIAINALGKPSDFDPQSNAIVRINAGRLRRLLIEYYRGPGIADKIKIEVVKGTYVPVFRADEIKRQNLETEGQKPNFDDNRVTFTRSKLTLAILPFRNLCPDNEYQFFVDGFGEELSQIFSTSEDIAVISHYSTLKYTNPIKDIRSVGADLGVHYVITGAVLRTNKCIKVNIALVETVNSVQIWSKKYIHDLKKDENIEIQDHINEDVFSLLSGHYGFIQRNSLLFVENDMKHDLQSCDAILWYNYIQISQLEDDFIKCRKAIDKVLQKNPKHAMCLLISADLYLTCYSLGYKTVENPVEKAFALIQKALIIEPFSQFGNLLLGWVNIYLGKQQEAIKALEYGMKLAPLSLSLKGILGFGFACAGDYKRSQILLQEALEFNPYCPWWYYMGFYFVQFQEANFENALRTTQKMNASDDVYLIPLLKVAAQGQLGKIADAASNVNLLQEQFPDILANLRMYLNTFILDKSLIDGIIQGVRKAGLIIG